jgi:hypothetical protein
MGKFPDASVYLKREKSIHSIMPDGWHWPTRDFPLSPVPFPGNKPVDAFLLYRPDISFVCIPMDRLQKLKLFTGIRFAALPAAGDPFFLAALPDLAERRAAPVPAALFALELDHGPEEFVTVHVIHKGFSERRIRDRSGKFFILCNPQFFPEIAGKVGNLPGVPVAVKTTEAAVGRQLKVLLFHTQLFSLQSICFPRGE